MQTAIVPQLVPAGITNPDFLGMLKRLDLSALERTIRQIDPNWLTVRIGFGPSDDPSVPSSATVNGPNRGNTSFFERLPHLVSEKDLIALALLAHTAGNTGTIVFRNPAHRFVPIEGRVRIHFENCSSGTIDHVDRSGHGFTVDELPREVYTAERLLRELEDRGYNGQAVDFEYMPPVRVHFDDDCA